MMATQWWETADPQIVREKFESLLAVVHEVEASTDEREAIATVVLNIAELGFPNVLISLLDERKKPRVIRAVEAFGREWERIKKDTVREFPGDDILAKVLERGEPKFVADSRRDAETDKLSIAKAGIVSQYVIPLMTKDTRIGVMQVHMGKCEKRPDVACKILDAVGTHLSLAISRFRALDRLSEANEAIMSNARMAIANEVAGSMIHQLSHQVDKFEKNLHVMLRQEHIRNNKVAFTILHDLKREVAPWKMMLDKPLKYIGGEENPERCSVNVVVREALEYWYETMFAKKCSLRLIEGADRVTVEIRPSNLREVLSCLIVNALQAHAHTIEIKIDKSLEDCGGLEKEMCAVIQVSDDGDGIPVELVNEIFKQGFTTKRKIGTGFGLFIVKRLAHAMSGEVYLKSGGKSAGKRRTVFRVIIPAENGES
jgi:K+-sensing histidine kinase KdpD